MKKMALYTQSSFLSSLCFLSLTFASEAIVTVSLAWTILKKGGSAQSLGVLMFFTALIPFLLQKRSASFKEKISSNPASAFAMIRMMGISFALSAAFIAPICGVYALYLIACLFSIITFFSTQSFETLLSMQVMEGKFSSNYASRILQTAIQSGALLGGSIAGVLMDVGGFRWVFLTIAIGYALGVFGIQTIQNLHDDSSDNKSTAFVSHNHTILRSLGVVSAFAMIAMITMHVSAFNLLFPVLAQKERGWSATQFGIIDAFVGVGALSAALFITRSGRFRNLWTLGFLAMVLLTSLFGLNSSMSLALVLALGMGFFGNSIRIKQREILFSQVSDSGQAMNWSGYLTLVNMLVKSMTPLIICFFLKTNSASQGLVCLAGVIGFSMGFFQLIQFFARDPQRNFSPEIASRSASG